MSRTSKSVKNSKVALLFYIINLGLGFVSRKVFIDHLGADVLGLNTTVSNLLEFLNLAELGIGAAITCTLYKPIADGNKKQIDEIVSLQGWLYRRIAYYFIGAALLLMCFFPFIFAKITLPLWYAFASFGALLVSTLLSYFVNYRQVLLSANQKEYKIAYSYKSTILVRTVIQVFAVMYLPHGYIWWLVIQFLFAFIASYLLNRTIKKEYPFLTSSVKCGKELRHKYPDIIKKVKQVFFHKIGGLALTQTSPLIIYAYTSLPIVTIYGNYMLIFTGISLMLQAVFSSMNAAVGNLIAEGDRQHIMDVFEELFSSRFLFATVVCFGVYTLSSAFITLWVGKEYILDNTILALMTFITYINLTRTVVDSYINSYGLFSDVWAPIAEATINISLSILLGYFWGISGVLSGVVISLLLIVCLWKPYLLFRRGLHEKLEKYIVICIKHLLVVIPVYFVTKFIIHHIPIEASLSVLNFIFCILLYLSIFTIILVPLLYFTNKGMKAFISRSIAILKNRIQNDCSS